MSTGTASVLDRRSRALLVFCSIAVAFAAVDTYVVVLALPDMMGSVGIGVEQLQRAAPIVSGFLLGYVAMLPLIGRIADLRGPVPVLAASLVVFTVGSLITTAAYDLPSMVIGRFLQGVGGGGLVPATMALVAALYPVERRGLPLGVVSAVQEFGSVLGPLFGAAVLSFTSWRGIFAINAAVGVLLIVVVRVLRNDRDLAHTAEVAPVRSSLGTARRPWRSAARRRGRRSGAGRQSATQPLHRHHVGRAVRARGLGRWPLALPGGPGRDRGVRRVLRALPVRAASVGRRPLVGGEPARGRRRRRHLPRARPGRHRPGVRDGRPRGRGLLARKDRGSSSAPRWRRSPSCCTCVAPPTRSCRAARSGRRPRGGRWW